MSQADYQCNRMEKKPGKDSHEIVMPGTGVCMVLSPRFYSFDLDNESVPENKAPIMDEVNSDFIFRQW